MSRILGSIGKLMLLTVFVAVKSASAGVETAATSVHLHPWFKDRLPYVFECLALSEPSRVVSHFFVSKVWLRSNCSIAESKDGCIDVESHGYPIVYWKEKNELILFEPQYSESDNYNDLRFSRRRWSYAEDTQLEKYPGSSYQLTKEEWKKMKESAITADSFTVNRGSIIGTTKDCKKILP